MIAKLTGVIDSKSADAAIVDVGGVGYLVFCSARSLNRLPAAGGWPTPASASCATLRWPHRWPKPAASSGLPSTAPM